MLHHTLPRLYTTLKLDMSKPLSISGDQAHYLLHVLRIKIGNNIRLFNGLDGEWLGETTAVSKKSLEISLKSQTREQITSNNLWLCCAPIKKAHFEYMIEKATELGVAHIQPLLTARTQIREVNIERCQAIATEAAEQSERLDIPLIHPPVSLQHFIKDEHRDAHVIVCAEYGDALPINYALQNLASNPKQKTIIVTGPEGGFAPEEFDELRKISAALFVRLGPRILRADTAAISALSCWQAMKGDWTPPQ